MGTLMSSLKRTPPPSSQMCAMSFTLLVVLLRRPNVYSSATVGLGLSSTARARNSRRMEQRIRDSETKQHKRARVRAYVWIDSETA